MFSGLDALCTHICMLCVSFTFISFGSLWNIQLRSVHVVWLTLALYKLMACMVQTLVFVVALGNL